MQETPEIFELIEIEEEVVTDVATIIDHLTEETYDGTHVVVSDHYSVKGIRLA